MSDETRVSFLMSRQLNPLGLGALDSRLLGYKWLAPGVLLVRTPIRGWHLAGEDEKSILATTGGRR